MQRNTPFLLKWNYTEFYVSAIRMNNVIFNYKTKLNHKHQNLIRHCATLGAKYTLSNFQPSNRTCKPLRWKM